MMRPEGLLAAHGVLAAVVAILMLPFFIGPTPLQDSHAINLVWADQFDRLLRAGVAWPRWLPWSHDGRGAPVFYFYGPVAFWLAAAGIPFDLSLFHSIAAAATVALAVSGIATFHLLHGRGAPHPLAGALFYVVAPYHLLDFGRRGAIAEFTAMALLPMLALAVRRARSGSPLALALGYAALVMTHLPMALLASVFLLPLLVFEPGLPHRRQLGSLALGLGGGLGLAAPYLLPALALQPYVAIQAMQATPLQHPAEWTIATYLAGAAPAHALLFAIGIGLILLGLASWRSDRSRWTIALPILTAIALGAAAPLWLVPPLDRVQFPWRLLGVAEFVAALVVGSSRSSGPRLLFACAPPLVLAWLVEAPAWQAIGSPEPRAAIAELLRHHPDVPEYLVQTLTAFPAPLPVWPEHVGVAIAVATLLLLSFSSLATSTTALIRCRRRAKAFA